ncbi:MAG: PD-(D/E)XK nuclease family protein, partial [Candidatus Riflebacteria bacterium]|nr:PD-(D/E)XK nuclease family protein [Candidatus Riflebacteria bacterium]
INKLMEHANKALNNHSELDNETRNSLLSDCKTAFEYIHEIISQKGFTNYKSLKTELKYSFNTVVLSANVDRIDLLPNGKLQIVIYKTGKQTPNENTIKNDIFSAFYWFIANYLYPDEVDSISFVYLLSKQTIKFIPSEIAIERLKVSVLDFIKEKSFEGKEGSLCSWCDYYGPCPKWKIKPYEVAKESIDEFKQRIRLSYSKMSLYLNCPYSYKRLYIDRIAPKPQPFFDFGTAIHETFERIYAPSETAIEKPSLDDLLNVYEKVRLCYRDGFANEKIEEEYHQDGIRQLTLYYNHFIKSKVFKSAASVERYFEIPCGKYAVMTGSIDRIDALDDGTFEILDYKTEPTLRPQEEVDKDKQLSIYYWAAQNFMGYKISKLSLLMLDHDIKIKTSRKESDIDAVLETIDRTAYDMIHETSFIPKINKYCKSCDHLNTCPLKEKILSSKELTSMQKFSDEKIDIEV